MIYSWHQAQWQQLIEHWQHQPNAWLFSGQENTGKTAFARHFAQALLCEMPSAQHEACHNCPSCHLFAQGTHPDFYELTPETPEGEATGRKLLQIKIDEVRNTLEQVQLSSVRSGLRVVLIHPAESLNTQAANSLLKTLEEPPQDVIFLLVSHARDKLLPTIKSRCRQMILHAPTPQQALQHLHEQHPERAAELLAFHSGSPLFQHDAEQDALRHELLYLLISPRLLAILDYAQTYDQKKWALANFIEWLNKWLIDLALAQNKLPARYYPAHQEALNQIAHKTQATLLFALHNTLMQLSPYGKHTLNVRLQIEYLLTQYLAFWQNKPSYTQ